MEYPLANDFRIGESVYLDEVKPVIVKSPPHKSGGEDYTVVEQHGAIKSVKTSRLSDRYKGVDLEVGLPVRVRRNSSAVITGTEIGEIKGKIASVEGSVITVRLDQSMMTIGLGAEVYRTYQREQLEIIF